MGMTVWREVLNRVTSGRHWSQWQACSQHMWGHQDYSCRYDKAWIAKTHDAKVSGKGVHTSGLPVNACEDAVGLHSAAT
jgi:hypothetical protein